MPLAISTFPLFFSSMSIGGEVREAQRSHRARNTMSSIRSREMLCEPCKYNFTRERRCTLRVYRATRSFSLLFSSPLPFVFPSFPNRRVYLSRRFFGIVGRYFRRKPPFLIRYCWIRLSIKGASLFVGYHAFILESHCFKFHSGECVALRANIFNIATTASYLTHPFSTRRDKHYFELSYTIYTQISMGSHGYCFVNWVLLGTARTVACTLQEF